MYNLFFLSQSFIFSIQTMSQELPFSSIPKAPVNYSASNSISRMIQGLGFRYHWATEGLKAKDLKYRPTDESRSTLGTIQHIYSLSKTILNAAKNKVSKRSKDHPSEHLDELRIITLNNLSKASELFSSYNENELNEINIIFERGGKLSKFPIWNLINGPIADALYHTGQVVSFRRTSGNPIPKGVNVFLGIKS